MAGRLAVGSQQGATFQNEASRCVDYFRYCPFMSPKAPLLQSLKPLFLNGQTFSRLDPGLPVELRRFCVCGGRFKEQMQGREREAGLEGQAQNAWKVISRSNVAEMVTGPKPKLRIAVACDAGLGKSTNMQWLESMMARAPGQGLVPALLRLDQGNRPHLSLIQRESERPQDEPILDHFAAELTRCTGKPVPNGDSLKELRAQGRLALLLDGLDHAVSSKYFAHHLSNVLNATQWRNCPIWVAGRPYAFDQCWDDLFANGWEILRIDPLPEAEIRRGLVWNTGLDWYDDLPSVPQLLAVPRYLQLLCGILKRAVASVTNDPLARKKAIADLGLRYPADIYHHAYFDRGIYGRIDTYGLLAQGVGNAEKIGLEPGEEPSEENLGRRIERTAELVGVIAFTLMSGDPGAEKPHPNTTGLPIEELQAALQPRFHSTGSWSRKEIEKDLKLLRQMNSHALDFLLFAEAEEKRWVFANRTTQAFFAAYWAVKWGTPGDLEQILSWRVGEYINPNSAYDEFWQFAAQMPGRLVDREKWLKIFRPSYAETKILYREWDHLSWHHRAIYWTHPNMEQWAPAAINHWRVGAESLQKELNAGWRRCPPDPGLARPQQYTMGTTDILEGHFGYESPRSVEVEPFLMQEFVVTNKQFRLFDPYHTLEPEISETDDQPVMNIPFWTAWCFAYWVDCRLPTEEEWEFACRAGTVTPFNYGDRPDPQKMNFRSQVGATSIKGNYPPNAWGLYDMHGNVWEWCNSHYYPGISIGLLRGGSWCFDFQCCRSDFRYWASSPSGEYSSGLRLVTDSSRP